MRLLIRNPYRIKNNFKNLFCRYCHIFGHKYFEFEILRDNYYLFEAEAKWTTKRDHAGIKIIIGIFGYAIGATIYDNRHWDTKKNCWIESPLVKPK
jgi:hypothetical protein